MADKYDLIVIGAGPGGYVAAIRGSQLGLKTACIERERPGGICLNWGCIPTKALLKSAEAMRLVQHAADYGVTINGTVSFDWQKVIARSRATADRMAKGIETLFKKYKVDHIAGHGLVQGPGQAGRGHRRRAPGAWKPRTSSWPPAPGRSSSPASSPTAIGSSPTARRWCCPSCPSRWW